VYSDRLRELFHSRAHAGKLEDATHYGEAGTPGHGPYVQLWLRVDGGVVSQASYKTYGCPAVIGCSEALCEGLEGRPLSQAQAMPVERLIEWVGELPEGKEHCPALVSAAMGAVEPCKTPGIYSGP